MYKACSMPSYFALFLLALTASACTPAIQPTSSSRGLASTAPVSYRCTGNEPFWSLDISPEGIVFQSPESPPVTYPYTASKNNDGSLEFNTSLNTSTAKSTLKVVLTPGDCSDGMSDIQYPYSVEVVRDGQRLRGCAKAI